MDSCDFIRAKKPFLSSTSRQFAQWVIPIALDRTVALCNVSFSCLLLIRGAYRSFRR